MVLINSRFILLPNDDVVSQLGLRYTDLLIYLSLRSFHNAEHERCFPSYEIIAELASVQKRTVVSAIKRLEKSKLIKVTRSNKKRVSNKYSFSEAMRYNRIPYSVFDTDDLTFHEKAMLIYARQLFDSLYLTCYHTCFKEIAALLGLTYQVAYKQLNSLVKKGYISKEYYHLRSGVKSNLQKLCLTDKINWQYIERPVPKPKQVQPFTVLFK